MEPKLSERPELEPPKNSSGSTTLNICKILYDIWFLWRPCYCGELPTPLVDGQTSWAYPINPAQYMYISCYVTVNKLVLSYLSLRLLPHYQDNCDIHYIKMPIMTMTVKCLMSVLFLMSGMFISIKSILCHDINLNLNILHNCNARGMLFMFVMSMMNEMFEMYGMWYIWKIHVPYMTFKMYVIYVMYGKRLLCTQFL